MNKHEIVEKLGGIIAKEILRQPRKVIKPDESLIKSGLIDSFSLVDLGLAVERDFDVRLDDTELNADTFDTLNQLADVILERRK
ncbi:MAG TPA: acyl carrier protein [Thermoflexales bacterium]|nr:acyl carrier protein [Thermoflexales bacterium]HQW34184.1 acyl carrier protein [Thermoflexales bacterium]HQX76794.1 acyl carrier protein [Thermoflexales bacterium]HQZ20838.1 acyl carrier protein [Thermoflexales bacterium]HQZ99311.1 acyl carrier protein [Thermoflexales bacterium]